MSRTFCTERNRHVFWDARMEKLKCCARERRKRTASLNRTQSLRAIPDGCAFKRFLAPGLCGSDYRVSDERFAKALLSGKRFVGAGEFTRERKRRERRLYREYERKNSFPTGGRWMLSLPWGAKKRTKLVVVDEYGRESYDPKMYPGGFVFWDKYAHIEWCED